MGLLRSLCYHRAAPVVLACDWVANMAKVSEEHLQPLVAYYDMLGCVCHHMSVAFLMTDGSFEARHMPVVVRQSVQVEHTALLEPHRAQCTLVKSRLAWNVSGAHLSAYSSVMLLAG
jgi:hypothetical protein